MNETLDPAGHSSGAYKHIRLASSVQTLSIMELGALFDDRRHKIPYADKELQRVFSCVKLGRKQRRNYVVGWTTPGIKFQRQLEDPRNRTQLYKSTSALTRLNKRQTILRDQATADVCAGSKRHRSRDYSEFIESAIPVDTAPMTQRMHNQAINNCHRARQKILDKDDMYRALPALLARLRVDTAEESPQAAPAA